MDVKQRFHIKYVIQPTNHVNELRCELFAYILLQYQRWLTSVYFVKKIHSPTNLRPNLTIRKIEVDDAQTLQNH